LVQLKDKNMEESRKIEQEEKRIEIEKETSKQKEDE
jgi:hypothetical protein